MAQAMAGPLTRIVAEWSPGLVVFEETTYAAPLVAHAAGVPSVRHLWGVDVMSYIRWSEAISLGPLAGRLGCPSTDGSRIATVDPCPPSLQVPADYGRTGMRYIPYNGSAAVPRWLDAPPAGRPRVCVTYGKTLSKVENATPLIDRVVEAVGGLDVDVVAAVSPDDRRRIGDLPANVRAVVDQPLSAFLPGCSLIVSHGGPGTVLTAAAYGVPQLSIPQVGDQILLAELTTQQGCGRRISVEDASVERIRAAAEDLLADAASRRAAGELAEQNASRPSPAATAAALVEAAEAYRPVPPA
jgi:UDP:flavonoid glycosyltransferase YjiC (YdhE family)